MLPYLPCFLLLLVPSLGSEPEDQVEADKGFPPRVIRPEEIKEMIKGIKLVGQVGGMGTIDGIHTGMIRDDYEVELPGFEGKQRITVGYIQNDGTINYFKGPGFLYEAEGGKLVRKKLVRLSSRDLAVFEQAIRHAANFRGYADGRSLYLDLRKDQESFRASKQLLKRLSDLDITWQHSGDWHPDRPDQDEVTAEIVELTADRAKFCWKERRWTDRGPKRGAEHQWTYQLELRDGKWEKVDK